MVIMEASPQQFMDVFRLSGLIFVGLESIQAMEIILNCRIAKFEKLLDEQMKYLENKYAQ